ncbi:heparan sulfate glucosamine 3-O-sulfotransferase 6-like [Dermacentor albipictus]|uniref:heparan sulfate glucosamine 3-O-sulfotransferase 6-like n=1 Tax=Dermacentor albipictus TaxID=60249 RepID=UPI0031FD0276
MSPAYRTSVRRLVVYTAALCILIGYAFFAPDLTLASGAHYEQSLPRQVILNEQNRAASQSVAIGALAEDDVVGASATSGDIRKGRGKERRDVDVALPGGHVDLETSFGRRQGSGTAERVRLLRRSASSPPGRLTLALKTTPSPKIAKVSRVPEAINGSRRRDTGVTQNSKPKIRPEWTSQAFGAAEDIDAFNEVLDGEKTTSDEQASKFADGEVISDYAHSVTTDSANGVNSLEFGRGGNVTRSNKPRAHLGVRAAAAPDADVAESPERRLPQAIIIGVKKGGTRAVLEYLRLHPQVRAAGPEPHFFDKHYHRGFDWYRSQMPESVRGQLTMEKTPSYLVRERVPARVRAMSPSVKLVLVLRDPVTRAVSDYAQASAKGRARRSFLHSVTDNRTGTVDRSKPLVRVGLYDEHVSRWLEHFPLSSFHFVSGERLVAQPERELASLQRFLGLRPPWVGARQLVFNRTKGFPCLLREPGATPHCLDPSKGRPHPKVDPSLERRLREFYAPHNRRLYRVIGRDLGWPP